MKVPPYLKPGDTIGITCPAGYVSFERVAYAITVLEKWGFKVKVGKTVGSEHFYFSGNDAARLTDLQQMLDDESIAAILMGRGGYGVSRIIDELDFSKFIESPKWICGFSDITVLHSHLHAIYKIPTLHSPMCGAFQPETENADYILQFRAALTGQPVSQEFPASPYNRTGEATGILTGGNLAMLAHLTGSVSEADMDGKILFVEDIGEHYYNVDRLLLNLKRAGKLEGLTALLVGSFTDMQDTERPFGQTPEEIIWDKVREYDYPVAFNFPCGHQAVNYTLKLGMDYHLKITDDGSFLSTAAQQV
ncbi:MAG TPA: LD-carboxypeptidase [Flavipsychrobacter sp.]|nr:LD-carboxypeptidase [Flavipsychrobacter sp.]